MKGLSKKQIAQLTVLTSIVYIARLDGKHYHLDKNCYMLSGNQFKEFGYKYITWNEIKRRKLIPCICVFNILKQCDLTKKELEKMKLKTMLKKLFTFNKNEDYSNIDLWNDLL